MPESVRFPEEEKIGDVEIEGSGEGAGEPEELEPGVAAEAVDEDEVGAAESAVGGGPEVDGGVAVEFDGGGGEAEG